MADTSLLRMNDEDEKSKKSGTFVLSEERKVIDVFFFSRIACKADLSEEDRRCRNFGVPLSPAGRP